MYNFIKQNYEITLKFVKFTVENHKKLNVRFCLQWKMADRHSTTAFLKTETPIQMLLANCAPYFENDKNVLNFRNKLFLSIKRLSNHSLSTYQLNSTNLSKFIPEINVISTTFVCYQVSVI